ncbi:MAG TPA: hypothetical protein VK760_14415, partial [Candidatus Acidoferrales bacterium]|nr:hypothetical protein [Candidatus Acidoferrales bacterium]
MSAERERLEAEHEHKALWRRWGPYLSERQWGTAREDYSPYGTAWEYFPHDMARSRAYRWGEDGIGGISDNKQRLCFAPAFWNGKDPILKERLFGLTGNQGNHGEDVKEYYFFLDNLPSHAYMKMIYRYPHAAYPYEQILEENARRTKLDPEYELIDTGVFNEDRFFDACVEYAKAGPEEFLVRISVTNHGPEAASIVVLPTLWFRNTWSWSFNAPKPSLTIGYANKIAGVDNIVIAHPTLNEHHLYIEGASELLFTENETNYERVFNSPNPTPYVKDSINDYIVNGKAEGINPARIGTKMSAVYRLDLAPGETRILRARLCDKPHADPFGNFKATFDQRISEADAFYGELNDFAVSADEKQIQREAFAGILWSKQFYEYSVRDWLIGDPAMPAPPPERLHGRNCDWEHVHAENVLSMPDTW